MSDDLDFMPASKPAKGKAPASEPAAERSPGKTETSKPETGKTVASKPETGNTDSGKTDGDAPARAELPTWNRARRKRKANAEAEMLDDAFQRGVRKAGRQVIDFPKLVIGGLIILVAAVGVGVTLMQRAGQGDAEASRVLQGATRAIARGQVVSAEEQAQFADQISRFRIPIYTTEDERQAAIDETLAAALASESEAISLDATLIAAAQAVREGEFAAAIESYDKVLAEFDEDHPLRFLALEGKGIALEASEDYEGALAVFEQLAPEPSDFYRSTALYHRGRVLEQLGRKDDAIALYKQFYEEFPPGKEVQGMPEIKSRLEELDPEFVLSLEAAAPASDSLVDPFALPSP